MKKIFGYSIMTILLLSIKPVNSPAQPSQNDSVKIYDEIESFSERSKFTRFIYELFFRPTDEIPDNDDEQKDKSRLQPSYQSYQGKVIRKIHIESMDPFGNTLPDTVSGNPNIILRAGNKLHIKSQELTIRNLLIIRHNQIFDSLLFKESERLVRSRDYIRDVAFFVRNTGENSDSVDIFIRVLDNWSIIPEIGASPQDVTITLSDRNFIGLGHDFRNELTWYPQIKEYAYNTSYSIRNIRNTYISSTLQYGTDEYGNFMKGVSLSRPFFSPYTRWAAGINLSQRFYNDSLVTREFGFIPQKIRFNVQDIWVGHSIQLFKGYSEEVRATRLISAIRFVRYRYLERPTGDYRFESLFSDEDFFLLSIGISTRKYVQNKYIFEYGLTEDVPVGKAYVLTAGIQRRNNNDRLYLKARASFGNFHPWGYFSTNLEFGTFFNSGQSEQGAFTAGVIYFTGLHELGRWKFRQFVRPEITLGFNRTILDSLTLNDDYGLTGFKTAGLSGTSRLLLKFQTQSYAPWDVIGFRFGPYISCSFGMLGNEETGFSQSRLYTQVGLGILIKNENLVINTFQLSFSFYPEIPGKGYNILKLNTFKTNDFGFRDFEIDKPSEAEFQ